MEGKNKYSIDFTGGLIRNYQQSISALYLPLIGKKATCLYLLLVAETKYYSYAALERLLALTHLDINELEDAVVVLEQFELLKTYKKNEDYLFVLKSPLDFREFFNHQIYSRLYMNKVGKEQYEITRALYCKNEIKREEYEDITHGFDKSVMSLWNDYDEKNYQEVKSSIVNNEKEIDFDYNEFFKNATSLTFPIAMRTKENMDQIGKLATIFAINPDRMRVIVCRSMDYTQQTIDWAAVRKKCLSEKTVELKEGNNPYDDNPVAFLYRRQGVPVSSADKRLFESLQKDYGMSREVINVLIEHTLNSTNNQLNRAYVEKVASTWIRQGVDSVEKAKAAITDLASSQPARYNRKKNQFDASEMKVGEQNIEALRAKMFAQKEKKNGKD